MHVMDVAAAVQSVVTDDGSSCGLTYELGGPETLPIKDLVSPW